MNTFPPGGPDDDPFEPIQKPFEKPIEKIKADKEVPEKFKREKEVPEKIKPEKEAKLEKFEKEKREKEKREKEKPEKEGKLEIKEGKEFEKPLEKPIGEKQPEKQSIEKQIEKQSIEKQFIPEKVVVEKPPEIETIVATKLAATENPLAFGQEAVNPAIRIDPAIDVNTLLQHADSLEQSGRALRHFIQRSQRPDLSTGALANEEDQQEDEDA